MVLYLVQAGQTRLKKSAEHMLIAELPRSIVNIRDHFDAK
jgi:hypothetical protein